MRCVFFVFFFVLISFEAFDEPWKEQFGGVEP